VFDFNKDPGEGNLNLRAYLASVVGPRRLAHGQRKVTQVPVGSPVLLFGNRAQIEVSYVEVWLPQSSILALPGGGAYLGFASGESLGQSAVQILLNATQRFSSVLLPSDQVHAEAVSDANGGVLAASVPVVISTVVF
jgi:hypothetical protein